MNIDHFYANKIYHQPDKEKIFEGNKLFDLRYIDDFELLFVTRTIGEHKYGKKYNPDNPAQLKEIILAIGYDGIINKEGVIDLKETDNKIEKKNLKIKVMSTPILTTYGIIIKQQLKEKYPLIYQILNTLETLDNYCLTMELQAIERENYLVGNGLMHSEALEIIIKDLTPKMKDLLPFAPQEKISGII